MNPPRKMVKRENILGRGLDALLDPSSVRSRGASAICEVELEMITPNTEQPRNEFDVTALEELASSIKQVGIIQPITLRKQADGKLFIVAGERRFRAAQMVGLTTIPAYVRHIGDEDVLEMALIENIQREDLNAIEIALAYQHLLEQHQLTQEMLSERIGKKRTTIANYLRLLKLPAEIQVALRDKTIDMGHARALLSIEDTIEQHRIFEIILKKGLSVRKVEDMVKLCNRKKENSKATNRTVRTTEEYDILTEHLSNFFKSKVQLKCDVKGKGSLTINFASDHDLERILEILGRLS